MARLCFLVLIVVLMPSPARAYQFTCAQVREAVRTLPKDVLDSYLAKASPDDIARGRKCFRKRMRFRR